jgi:hypothetical protein
VARTAMLGPGQMPPPRSERTLSESRETKAYRLAQACVGGHLSTDANEPPVSHDADVGAAGQTPLSNERKCERFWTRPERIEGRKAQTVDPRPAASKVQRAAIEGLGRRLALSRMRVGG